MNSIIHLVQFMIRISNAHHDMTVIGINFKVSQPVGYGLFRKLHATPCITSTRRQLSQAPINGNIEYDVPQRQYDTDKAKWHLKQAGMDSLDVEISAADAAFGGAVEASELYAEQLRPAGINLTVKRASPDGYWDNVWMKVPWSACYWGGRPTADWMFTIGYQAGGNWTDTFWNNPRFEKLLIAGRAELDDAKRNDIYVEMQTIVSNEGGVVIPCFANNVDASSTAMGHADKLAGNWELDGSRSASRWWFA